MISQIIRNKIMASQKKTNPIQVQKYLKGMNYPAQKKDLVQHAKVQNAPDDIMAVLKKLPDNEYKRPTDVAKGVSQIQ